MNQKPDEKALDDISRRKFIKSSAMMVGGSLLSTLPFGTKAYTGKSEKLKLALVGCGGRGTGAAVQALSTEGPVELVAMADVFRDMLDRSYENLLKIEEVSDRVNVPEKHKFIGFDAYKKAIEVADVIILATPPGFRPIQFEEVVKAGKHAFLEKPLASDGPGIRSIMESGNIAKEKNLSVVVGLQNRYDIAYQELVKRLQDGAIGDIVSAKCNYLIGDLRHHPRKPQQNELVFQLRNWHYFDWLWAGAPAGLMIHHTDIVHWVKDSHPVKAQGIGGRAALKGPDSGDIYDHFYIDYEYSDGTHLNSQIRYIDGCFFDRGAHFIGTKGTAKAKDGIKDFRIVDHKGKVIWQHDTENDPNSYQTEHDKLFESIRKGKAINNVEGGAYSTLTALMGRMAVQSGNFVELDEARSSNLSLVPEITSFDSIPPVLPGEDGDYPVPVPGKYEI